MSQTHNYFDIEVSNDEYHNGHYRPVTRLSHDRLPTVGIGPFTYLDGIDVIHDDHTVEHVTKVIAVTGPNERCVLNSRSGVCWWGYDQTDVSDSELEMMLSLADSGAPLAHDPGHDDPTFDCLDDYVTALSGWYSSMERSQQSDMMNALSSGELPPHAHDDVDPYPYFVKYGDTRNVCSHSATVYAKPELREMLRAEFDDARSAPAYSGF